MNRGVVIFLILGILLIYIHPLFAQNEPINKRIENKIKGEITSTKETLKSGFLNSLRKTGSWIRFNLTQKMVDWWDFKVKPYLISFWRQLIKLLDREIYL